MRALAGFVWMVWHRDGRDVSIDQILDGTVDVNLAEVNIEADEGEADPTDPTPTASPTTASGTSGSSPKSSTSVPGK